jgi:hypothetical protein
MPYEPLTRFPTPPDETVVWRYMDFPKFTLLLAHSALWFARCDHLEDRFEGSLTAPMVRRYEGLAFAPQVADAIQLFREHRKRMRERVAVNCWHMGACESAALWQAYGREGQGIVVRTRLGGLKEAVARVSYPVHIAPVTYLNYKEDDMEPPTPTATLQASELSARARGAHAPVDATKPRARQPAAARTRSCHTRLVGQTC